MFGHQECVEEDGETGGVFRSCKSWIQIDTDVTHAFGSVSPNTSNIQASNARGVHDDKQTHQANTDAVLVW